MTNECKQFLENYIHTHTYGKQADYDIGKLFKLYSAYAITCPQDINPAIDDFFEFLKDSRKIVFPGESKLFLKKHDNAVLKYINTSSRVFRDIMSSPLSAHQNAFVNIVHDIAPHKETTKILEVGAGLFPKTAITLAKHFTSVTAVDQNFLISCDSLKAINVAAVEKLFDANTQIADFDFVVGRRPCSAIINIVKLCATQNKPYFIELCDCCLPNNPNPEKYIWWGWEDILPQYDSNIKFCYPYAYNIKDKKVVKAIKKHTNTLFKKDPPKNVGISAVNCNGATWGIEEKDIFL